MNILVLSQDYPSQNNPYAMSYVHTRCVWCVNNSCKVTVLNFSADRCYEHEGVNVIVESKVGDLAEYDCIVSHAPNIKNHVRFLRMVKGKKIAFFFHGHEVLRLIGDYPAPYLWNSASWARRSLVRLYDWVKMHCMRYWLAKISSVNNVGLVFVSNWMRAKFEENIGKDAAAFGAVRVIPNAANDIFLMSRYKADGVKKADFLTIRPLDDSKYAMDLVVKFARANPNLTFHVYGRGRFFDYNQIPENMVWFDEFVAQSKIPDLLMYYRAALMPTRFDAQGVMVCEMATFGMPVVTSDFSVCVEMLSGLDNVIFLQEADFGRAFDMQRITPSSALTNRFSASGLVAKEVEFFNEL